MIITLAALSLLAVDLQPITTFERRPDPPRTSEQAEDDDANEITEGERSGDAANPDRQICDWRQIPGSNRRQRVCQTVADRRNTRDVARETIQQMQGSVTDPVG